MTRPLSAYVKDGSVVQPIGETFQDGSSSSASSSLDSESHYTVQLAYSSYDMYRSVIEVTLSVSFLAANSNLLRLLISFKETESFIVSSSLVTASIMLQVLIAINVVTIAIHDRTRWFKLKLFTVAGAISLALLNIVIPFIINFEHSQVDLNELYGNQWP